MCKLFSKLLHIETAKMYINISHIILKNTFLKSIYMTGPTFSCSKLLIIDKGHAWIDTQHCASYPRCQNVCKINHA